MISAVGMTGIRMSRIHEGRVAKEGRPVILRRLSHEMDLAFDDMYVYRSKFASNARNTLS
jgi:hypothetical protein